MDKEDIITILYTIRSGFKTQLCRTEIEGIDAAIDLIEQMVVDTVEDFANE